jgi:hypothetical protein
MKSKSKSLPLIDSQLAGTPSQTVDAIALVLSSICGA